MNVWEAAAKAVESGRPAAIATVTAVGGSTPRSAGARMLVYGDGAIVGTIGGGQVEFQVVAFALRVIASGRPDTYRAHLTRDLGMCCGGQMEVYVEPIDVREPFVVYGAGHVAQALAPLLVELGFAVRIVDARDDLAVAERFVGCEVLVQDPVAHEEAAVADPSRFVIVLTHDHALDQALCEQLLGKPARWIGMIGSRAKVAKFKIRMRAAGLPAESLDRLRAPVGLDIGAETPAEIAVSIAGEVVRIRRGSQRPPVPMSEAG